MFSNKSLIKHLYRFGAKYYVHIPEDKQIGISKLSPKRIRCYDVGYKESSKILRLYDPHMHRVFTSRDVVFPDSTKCLESTKIELPADLFLDLDSDTP
jgi:hypothetical protein